MFLSLLALSMIE